MTPCAVCGEPAAALLCDECHEAVWARLDDVLASGEVAFEQLLGAGARRPGVDITAVVVAAEVAARSDLDAELAGLGGES